MARRLNLLNIPLEIRLKIYDLIFKDARIEIDTGDLRHWQPRTELLLTSKLIRKEALPRYHLELCARNVEVIEKNKIPGLPNFMQTSTTRVLTCDEGFLGLESVKDVFPKLKQMKIFQVPNPFAFGSPAGPILVPRGEESLEEFLHNVKTGIYDENLVRYASGRFGDEIEELGTKSVAAGVEVFATGRHAVNVRVEDTIGQVGNIAYVYKFGTSTIVERHFSEVEAEPDKYECLTKGWCSLCEN